MEGLSMVNHLTKLWLRVNLQARLNESESKKKPRNSNSSGIRYVFLRNVVSTRKDVGRRIEGFSWR